jgi:hypothetical protein
VRRVRSALNELAAGAKNLDLKPPAGRAPWRRLRTGELRVLYRPLTASEAADGGYLIARVIHRRELQRAVSSLGV